MTYKYELHCHTGAVSRCASIEPEKAVELYKEKGYDGMVITDHYSPQTFLDRHLLAPQKAADFYLDGWRRAKAAAGDDFTVLLGMEIRFYGNANDYLVYGVTPEFVKNSGNMMLLYPRRFHKLCQKNGMIFVQAHPFRPFLFRSMPKNLDGCEIANAKNNGSGVNEKAEEWAKKFSSPVLVGGSDLHRESQADKMGGIITEEKIRTNADLLRILKSGNYEIIK